MEQIIQWSDAIRIAQINEEELKEEQAHYLKEWIESDIQAFDARDVHHFAEMTGVSANDLRRMHKTDIYTPEMVNTFQNDATDDIFDFY